MEKKLHSIFLKKPAQSKQGHVGVKLCNQRNCNWSASQSKIMTRDLCWRDFRTVSTTVKIPEYFAGYGH